MSTEDLPRILTTAWRVSLAQEMAEEPAIRPEDVARVVKWCKEQAYLPPVSEHTAALFLKLADYNVDKAQSWIDNHFTFRTYYRNMFSDRDPQHKDVRFAINSIHIFILPGYMEPKRRVVFGSLKTAESSKFAPFPSLKYIFMSLEADILSQGVAAIDGYNVLFDARGFGFGHLATISLSLLKQLLSYILDGSNMAICEIVIINVNPVVEKLIQLIRSLSPKELHDKIKLYTKDKTESILAKYPAELRPKELGGNHELSLAQMSERNEQFVQEFREWYLADEKYLRVDESKRELGQQNKKVVKLQNDLRKLELD